MRIAILATSRNPLCEPYAGGQESHTAMLARGLRRIGHHVRLYARAGTDPDLADELVTYVDLPELSAVAALDPQLPEPDFLTDHAAFTGAVADLLARRDVDLVHNESLHFLPLAFSTALATPVVTTLHTPPFPWMELGIALAGPEAAYVCVSRANARDWTSLPGPARIIPNGVEDDGRGPGAGGEHLVWTGRFTRETGADIAIRAARRAGRQIRLAGPVSDPDWFDHAIAPELGPGVEHVGHLTHDQLAALVRGSAVALVTPRWDEPFGLVAAEAAMWGTPVVALDRGGLSEFLTTDMGVCVGRLCVAAAVEQDGAEGVGGAVRLPGSRVHDAARDALGSHRMVDEYAGLYRELVLEQGAAS